MAYHQRATQKSTSTPKPSAFTPLLSSDYYPEKKQRPTSGTLMLNPGQI